MRCPACNTYVPADVGSTCPQCGANVPAEAREPSLTPKPAQEVFAPYLSIRTQFAFGPANFQKASGEASLSFGPSGISIVTGEGRSWRKISYTDYTFLRQDGSRVLFELNGVETSVEFPGSLLASGADRAKLVFDILDRLKGRTDLSENPFSGRLADELHRRMK